nr:mucin-16 [Anas platyrhynchos]
MAWRKQDLRNLLWLLVLLVRIGFQKAGAAVSTTAVETSSSESQATSVPTTTASPTSTPPQPSATQAKSTGLSTKSENSSPALGTTTEVTWSTAGTSSTALLSSTPPETLTTPTTILRETSTSATGATSLPAATSAVTLSTTLETASSSPGTTAAPTTALSTASTATISSTSPTETGAAVSTTAVETSSSESQATSVPTTTASPTSTPPQPSATQAKSTGLSTKSENSSPALGTTTEVTWSTAGTSSTALLSSTPPETLTTPTTILRETSTSATGATSLPAATSAVTLSTTLETASSSPGTTAAPTTALSTASTATISSTSPTETGAAVSTTAVETSSSESQATSVPTTTASPTSTPPQPSATQAKSTGLSTKSENSSPALGTTTEVTWSTAGTSSTALLSSTPPETLTTPTTILRETSTSATGATSLPAATSAVTLSTTLETASSSPGTTAAPTTALSTASTATISSTSPTETGAAVSTTAVETSSSESQATSVPTTTASPTSTPPQPSATQAKSTGLSTKSENSSPALGTTTEVTWSTAGTSSTALLSSTPPETLTTPTTILRETSTSATGATSLPAATSAVTLSTTLETASSSPGTTAAPTTALSTASTATISSTSPTETGAAVSTTAVETSSSESQATSVPTTTASPTSTPPQPSATQAKSTGLSTKSENSSPALGTTTEVTWSTAGTSSTALLSSTPPETLTTPTTILRETSTSATGATSLPAATSAVTLSTTLETASSSPGTTAAPTTALSTASTATISSTSPTETGAAVSTTAVETSSSESQATSVPTTTASPTSTPPQPSATQAKKVAAGAPGPQLAVTGHRRGALRHGFVFSRPVGRGDNTGVDAVCTYTKEPSAPGLDRVGLYHEVSNKTGGISRLGPYNLDRDSLYVNGYNEPPVTPTPTHPPTTTAGPERFTINFTITNLPYDSNLATPNSARLNTTRRVMTTLLNRLLKDSSIGPAFLACGTTAFRPVGRGDNTGVDAVCTYTKEPSAPGLDRVGLYHEVSNKTGGISRLGPYNLDRDSLYVNGYNEPPVTPTPTHPPTTTAGPERFTINFTITNLPYDSNLATPNSARLNTTRRVMTTLLNRLLKDSSIGPAFLACGTTAFRPVGRGDNTGVDAVCTYTKEPSAPGLDRVGLYHEVSNKTGGISRLGPYNLDRDSLYVNGYNEPPVTPTPTHPPTTTAGPERFTINFTITNLPYDSNLATPNSARLNTTRRVMTTLLNRLLKDSSIGPAFLACGTTAFRPVGRGDNTGVDAVCTYTKEPSAPGLDRVGLYHEVSNKTGGISRLGPYNLDRDSLYVNGYNEPPVTPTPTHPPTTTAGPERFTINFTITNLPYDSNLATPNSARLNTTRRVMTTLLNRLLKDSSIGPAFLACGTTAFRPVGRGDNTGVDAVCTYTKEPSAPGLDRVGLYHEVSNKTGGISRLGPYNLDRDSLYVNGYNEPPVTPTPTHPPTTTAGPERFTINFTITNLPYDSNLATPNSARLNTTRRVMTTLLNRLLKDSSIGPAFLACGTTAFRPVGRGDNTGVDAVCTYTKEPSAPGLDRVGLYHEVSNKTGGISRLGPYNLDRDSLYVNGYNEPPVTPTPTHPPTTTAGPERFTINFTITNLPYDSNLATPNSARLNTTRRVMTTLLNRLLKDSSIGPAFLACGTTAFRPVGRGDNTGVDAVCTYTKEPSAPGLDRVGLYHEVSNKTGGISRLGPYNLDRDSLYVNGYNEPPVTPTPTHPPTTTAGPERFTINFTITNLPYDSNLATPNSARLNTTRRVMTTLLNRLLKDSSIGPAFLACGTTAFRPVGRGDNTGVDAVCTYTKEPSAPGLDRVGLYHEVSNKTGGISRLGPYNLDRDSLYVNGYNEPPVTPTPTHPPTTTAGPERFTINFTITNLPYDSNLATPNSARLNTTRRVMTTLLNRLLKDSSIGPAFLACGTTAFRPVGRGDNTGVDAVCTYTKEPSAPGLDRVGLYHEVSNKTGGISRLGPYNLDRDSLYVNGYNEPPVTPTPTHPPTTTAGPERFTINFTITNLPYDSNLATPNSARLNTTRRVMTTLLNRLLKDSSIGPAFLACGTTAFRPVGRGDNTGVDAVCTYTKEPSAPGLDRVGLYHEVSNKTGGISRLGPYNLDRDSLYVNGYNEPPVTPTSSFLIERNFTVNFTITNLLYSSLGDMNSEIFSAANQNLTYLLDRMLKNSSIKAVFRGCTVMVLRSVKNREVSAMDAVCTYKANATPTEFDQIKVYHELSKMTANCTELGPYRLDAASFYVNGYNELQPGLYLGMPNSKKFKSTEKVMYNYVDHLLQKSSIGSIYIGCRIMAFRSKEDRDDTEVDAICSYRDEPSDFTFNRVTVYNELRNMTNGITKLGHYSLNSQSLYINGNRTTSRHYSW